MHAQQHAFLGARAAVVELLRLLYQVLGQVFAQLVACPQLIHGQQQALTRVAVQGDEGGRDQDLVVVMHGPYCRQRHDHRP